MSHLDALPTSDADAPYWRDLLRHWLLDSPCVAVVARPSAEDAARREKEEEERVKDMVGGREEHTHTRTHAH